MLKPDSVIVDQYRNLRNAENGADYILSLIKISAFVRISLPHFGQQEITVPNFWILRIFMTNLITAIKNAKAIKEFLTFSYQNWQQPAPNLRFAYRRCQLGPKKNSPTSVKQDYVPTYGNPVTDNWLSALTVRTMFCRTCLLAGWRLRQMKWGNRYSTRWKNMQRFPAPIGRSSFYLLMAALMIQSK